MSATEFVSDPEPISISDHVSRGSLFHKNGRKCWFLYSPIVAFSRSRANWRVVSETLDDALILYRLRETGSRLSAQILTPPVPFTPHALDHAIARVRQMTGRATVRIRYVERPDMAAIARAGFRLHLRDEEFHFRGADLASLASPRLKRVRREIGKTRSHPGLAIRDYRAEDREGCRAVLDRWRRRLLDAGRPVEGFRITARCLRQAPSWGRDLIRGRVCEVGGEIRGFSFGGPISPSCCNMFICITDVDLRGLAYLMRHDMVLQWPDHAEFNMGGAADQPGLRALKESFRPARISPIFGAVLS